MFTLSSAGDTLKPLNSQACSYNTGLSENNGNKQQIARNINGT